VTPAGPPAEFHTADFDTVILAGGRAARMGGADKPALPVGDTPMLVLVAQAAAAGGTRQLIVVGPPRPGAVQAGLETLAAALPGGLMRVREEPPGRGPIAGLRCGLTEVTAPWLALLAADLPFLTGAHLAALLAAGRADGSRGAVLTDDAGHPQWLAGCWQASSLRLGLAGYDGSSLHGLLAPLEPALLPPALLPPALLPPAQLPAAQSFAPRVPAPQAQRLAPVHGAAPWLDCDTLDDLAAARQAWLGRADDPAG
jgi:molybdenum cofactor guanylyltransferase